MADDYKPLADPYGGFNFHVEFEKTNDGIKASFSEISGLKGDVEEFEVKEGGLNTRTHKFPGRVSWGPVTLKRGIDKEQVLYDWWRTIVSNADGGGKRRRNVTITMLDEDFSTARKWTLENAWPKSWEGASLNSGGSELAFESIVLNHDGVTESKS